MKKENHRLKKKHDYEREVYEGIDAFEQNLKKFGLSKEESTDMPEEPKDGTKSSFGRTTNREDKTQKGGLTFKSEATIEKIRMRKRLRDMDAKERDKRRRKMIVD